MTDNELTRLCAEAMGFRRIATEPRRGLLTKSAVWVSRSEDGDMSIYDPIHPDWAGDAQVMALVKHFDIVIERDGPDRERKLFGVTLFPPRRLDGTTQKIATVRHSSSLNRAIVECVAKMALAQRQVTPQTEAEAK